MPRGKSTADFSAQGSPAAAAQNGPDVYVPSAFTEGLPAHGQAAWALR